VKGSFRNSGDVLKYVDTAGNRDVRKKSLFCLIKSAVGKLINSYPMTSFFLSVLDKDKRTRTTTIGKTKTLAAIW